MNPPRSAWWLALCLVSVAASDTKPAPRLYNQGVTAYRSNEFANAAQAFEQALSSPDRALQQRAFYNLGNTLYRLGQAQPAQAVTLWERAVNSYERALAVDPQDADARFNHDFVKQQLEDLKQQQQQQPQQQQDQDRKQDRQQDRDQSGEPDRSQSPQEQQIQQQRQQQQPQQQQQESGAQTNQQAQAQPSTQSTTNQPPPAAGETNEFAGLPARMLLDQLRENEQPWNFYPEVQMPDLKDTGQPAKDW